MKTIQRKRLKVIVIAASVLLISAVSAVWARPGVVACALIKNAPLTQWKASLFSESPDSEDHKLYESLLSQARKRIENTYGKSNSQPHIVFFDSVEPYPMYKPNLYGSTHFIGTRACIFIGPKGQNVDVVAHELVHADIFNAIGPINRALHMPVWLDEGLAMQVDYREKYVLDQPSIDELAAVRSWRTSSDFYAVDEDSDLSHRYALAKARVKRWVEVVGSATLYKELKSLISGGMSAATHDAGLSVN